MSAESLSGKGKKARDRLEAILTQTGGIASRLKSAQTALVSIIAQEKRTEGTEWKTKRDEATPKNRSAVKDAPGRIEFEEWGLPFYIDFTFSASESEGLVNVEGCIAYGVRRPLCFADCIFLEGRPEYKACDRVLRCDRFEDKPLVRFPVSRDGLIRSSGDLDDQWRIQDTTNGGGTTETEKGERGEENEKYGASQVRLHRDRTLTVFHEEQVYAF